MSEFFYIIPVPIGLFFAILVCCIRIVARESHTTQRRQVRVRRCVVVVPRQFESPHAPILAEGGMSHPEPPPNYNEATKSQQGVYVRTMQGYNQTSPNVNMHVVAAPAYAYPPPLYEPPQPASSQSATASAPAPQEVVLNASLLPKAE